MANEKQQPHRSEETKDQKPATFTGESRGSSPNTATGLGRDGDVIVQDDVVYGRPLSGRDRAEGDRAPDQQGTQPHHGAETPAGNPDPDR